jgi:5,6,7,8-tetrahydromethanopterin hydro-lyase
MYIGEAFIGSGPNAAHINVFIGPKDGPVGTAIASSVAAPRIGYIPFMVIHQPNGEICAVTFFKGRPGGPGRSNDKGCLQMNYVY